LTSQIEYGTIDIMKIKQTTLSIDDIADHREFLRDEPDKQAVDDMLVRFAHTFADGFITPLLEELWDNGDWKYG